MKEKSVVFDIVTYDNIFDSTFAVFGGGARGNLFGLCEFSTESNFMWLREATLIHCYRIVVIVTLLVNENKC